MPNQSMNILHTNEKNVVIIPNPKKYGDCYKNPCLSNIIDELCFSAKWWKEKLFLTNQSINIMYPSEENAIIEINHEKNENYYRNLHLSDFIEKL